MEDYRNIEKIDTQDDGSMNIFLRNGRRLLVEVSHLEQKFRAQIYSLFINRPEGERDLLVKLQQHDGYRDCAREALGWIDGNHEIILGPEEIKLKEM